MPETDSADVPADQPSAPTSVDPRPTPPRRFGIRALAVLVSLLVVVGAAGVYVFVRGGETPDEKVADAAASAFNAANEAWRKDPAGYCSAMFGGNYLRQEPGCTQRAQQAQDAGERAEDEAATIDPARISVLPGQTAVFRFTDIHYTGDYAGDPFDQTVPENEDTKWLLWNDPTTVLIMKLFPGKGYRMVGEYKAGLQTGLIPPDLATRVVLPSASATPAPSAPDVHNDVVQTTFRLTGSGSVIVIYEESVRGNLERVIRTVDLPFEVTADEPASLTPGFTVKFHGATGADCQILQKGVEVHSEHLVLASGGVARCQS